MYSTLAAAIALVVGASATVASDPIVCDRGPSQVPATSTLDLEHTVFDWGGYCEGWSEWSMTDTAAGLRLDHLGGEPYSNVHFYRNLSTPSSTRSFVLSMDFEVPSTTFNNTGAPSLVQALEFTFSRWASGTRHEWAIQWVNVGMAEPGYRYWDPRSGWIDTGIDATLSPGWHRLEISGQIVSGGAKLRSIEVDGTLYRLNITVPSTAAPGSGDIAAVAVQLDGNSQGQGYAVTLRNVDLVVR